MNKINGGVGSVTCQQYLKVRLRALKLSRRILVGDHVKAALRVSLSPPRQELKARISI